MEPRAMEPRLMEPRAMEPRAMEPASQGLQGGTCPARALLTAAEDHHPTLMEPPMDPPHGTHPWIPPMDPPLLIAAEDHHPSLRPRRILPPRRHRRHGLRGLRTRSEPRPMASRTTVPRARPRLPSSNGRSTLLSCSCGRIRRTSRASRPNHEAPPPPNRRKASHEPTG